MHRLQQHGHRSSSLFPFKSWAGEGREGGGGIGSGDAFHEVPQWAPSVAGSSRMRRQLI